MRIAVLLPLMLLLGACSNRVVSDSPWFTREAEANAPHLRPGLWVEMTTVKKWATECRFDERKPLDTWPDCASGYLVRSGEVLELSWSESTEQGRTIRTYDWSSRVHVLAAGDPRIDQVEGCQGLLKPRQEVPVGSSQPVDPDGYCYDAVRPTKFDAAGQIAAIVTWPVFCGPWPSKKQSDRTGREVTDRPFPGLHVVYENCTAESETALRKAARASERVAVSAGLWPVEAHWVRDDAH
jgi:hypothetical protein